MIESKFAEISDITNEAFVEINKKLQEINLEFNLPNHTELNNKRFNNNSIIQKTGTYYGARMWEYPFAIVNGDLKPGMKIADIGCGSTPFTVYLANVVGPNNVFGFDNDFLENDQTSDAFGVRKKFKERSKINFKFSNINAIEAEDNFFDCVYCISVLEHIENPAIWQKGLMEMARILKPGGKLIITFDFSITTKFINIGDVLNYTGLMPGNYLNMNWPEKRFLHIDGKAMDVFGLYLKKPLGTIDEDTSGKTKIKADAPFKSTVPAITDPSQLQIMKDLKRSKWLTLIKLILNKYK